jgi:hypothetical protein
MSGAALPTMALSLWAPWAWCILHAGKDIENRTLRAGRGARGHGGFPRHFLGEFWLHCSLWPGTRKPLGASGLEEMLDQFQAAHALCTKPRDQQPEKLTLKDLDAMRGKIVGRVTVTGYVEQSESPWFVPGSLGLVLSNPIPLATPVAASGALGWWKVPEDKLAELRGNADPPPRVEAR